ncbi:hypothetical protein RRG08_054594 [Elysia crispata]|uniref:PiggyBac transposable element-derived protein domain-containing protein n=1 Tax=Elysia crispata TaxID=231223 RepID=A0AAE1E7Z5_9GAST|nr:hypothetical protein RRG08_054594 [Elysia crispata]
MRVFIGICLYMSIVDMPFRRMYWASHSRQNAVADNMTCNRFEEILSLLHLNDNELMEPRGHPHHDPLFKVRPLLTKLNENFEKCAEKENCIAVDEMMVPFKGRHALKVYLMKKPKKWGYKVWVNAGQSGYVHKFIFAGESVLKTNDEYFEKKDLKKKGRGVFDFRVDGKKSVMVCKWFDNKIVAVASNVEGLYPTHMVKRSVNKDTRYDHIDHFPKKTVVKYAQRCKLEGCPGKTKYLCRKCCVDLCIDSKEQDESCFFFITTEKAMT